MKPTEEQCPVCGYYCLGKGGQGCIDKPSLVTSPTDTVTITEAQQTTWDWRENARQLITNPEIAVSAFGYEWLSDVARGALNDAWHLRTEFESTAIDVALATEQRAFDRRMRSGNIADRVDIDECRAIVAQHMKKEGK